MTTIQTKNLLLTSIGRIAANEKRKRNPQPGCVSHFEVVFSPPYGALCNATLYSILFFKFLFYIYKVRIRAHARQRRIGKSCGLRVAFSTPLRKAQLRHFATATLQPSETAVLGRFTTEYCGVPQRLYVFSLSSRTERSEVKDPGNIYVDAHEILRR